MIRTMTVAALLIVAAAAGAQTAVGSPPGTPPAATVVVTAPAPSAAPPAPQVLPQTPAELAALRYRTEIVCKTSIATGSLIAKRKTCLTRRQWDYVDQQHQDEARKLMLDNMGRPPGG